MIWKSQIDIGQIEGDLLARFVADDVGDLFDFDRRRFEEFRQARFARER
jgi:hypothetical protein